MTGNPHLETEPVVLGPESRPHRRVLVHGRGTGPETMLDLAGRLAEAGVRCVLPAAAGGTRGTRSGSRRRWPTTSRG